MTGPTAEAHRTAGLIFVLARKNFQVRFKRSYFGVAWLVVQPITQALVLAFIFTRIFRITQVPDYLVYVLSGVVPWALTLQSVNGAMSAVVDNASLIKKIAVPRLIFPVATVLAALMAFTAPLSVLLLVAGTRGTLGTHTWLLPLAVLLHLAVVFPVGVLLCSFYVVYRDLRFVMDALFLLLFYATPILFPLERVPPGFRIWIELNPLTGVLEVYRFVMMGRAVGLTSLLTSVGFSALATLAATWAWRWRSSSFADQV